MIKYNAKIDTMNLMIFQNVLVNEVSDENFQFFSFFLDFFSFKISL